MAGFGIKDVGSRGLVVFDGKDYSYITEVSWRNGTQIRGMPNELTPLRETKSVLAKLNNVTYVDLDRIAGLADPRGDNNGDRTLNSTKKSVVFREGDRFFQIMLDELNELPEGFEGSARTLVTRGAIVAAIPKNDIPSGTYCVLVNLANLNSK
jgi:hypothetical protein